MNLTGEDLASTMPTEMIEWVRTTATLIITGDIYREPKEPPVVCPAYRCSPCVIPLCPPPIKVTQFIEEPKPDQNYIKNPHTVTVHNVTSFDEISYIAKCAQNTKEEPSETIVVQD